MWVLVPGREAGGPVGNSSTGQQSSHLLMACPSLHGQTNTANFKGLHMCVRVRPTRATHTTRVCLCSSVEHDVDVPHPGIPGNFSGLSVNQFNLVLKQHMWFCCRC